MDKVAGEPPPTSRHRLERLVLDALPALVAFVDGAGRYAYVNAAWCAWFGEPAEMFMGKRPEEVHPDTFDDYLPHLNEVREGRRQNFQSAVTSRIGDRREVQIILEPWKNATGEDGFFVVATDVTELSRLERLLLQIIDGIDEAFIALDSDDRYVFFNRCAEEMSGRKRGEVIGRSMWDAFPKARRPDLQRAVRSVRKTRKPIERVVPSIARDGRLVALRMFPLHGDSIGLAVRDVTLEAEAEEMERLLSREIDHRARNVMNVVQSILRLTPFTTRDEYLNSVSSRVGALADGLSLLSRHRWKCAPLEEIVRSVLRPFQLKSTQIALSGPPVSLSSKAVQPLSLMLHELATNAAKHGSLSTQGGCLDVDWTETAEGLAIRWRERDGPPPVEPTRSGFGTMLLDASADQLLGSVEREWDGAGLSVTLLIGPQLLKQTGPRAAREDPDDGQRRPSVDLSGLRVLVVEDEALVRRDVERLLVGAGAEVTGSAGSLDTGLVHAMEGEFDVAVLDVSLGELSVAPLAQYLREKEKPFMLLTAYGDAGIDAPALTKPFACDELLATVSGIANRVPVG